jgi:hypothetical protein
MEAIEAVLELAKERDEIASELEVYESWFESLVGKEVTLSVSSKKKTKFVECVVTEFVTGEGWELTADETDEIFMVSFDDFTDGRVWLKERPVSKKVTFEE